MALFEATIFVLCLSSRPSSAFVSRPVVADFGTAADELRGGDIADFGVSGWTEALSLGSAANLEEDGPEFWADVGQIRADAKITNEKAILYFIIKNLRFGRCVLAPLITTHFRSSDCPKVIGEKLLSQR